MSQEIFQVINDDDVLRFSLLIKQDKEKYLNARDEVSYTPLMHATVRGLTVYVELLIDLGADINATTAEGDTALMLACLEERQDMALLLIDAGADTSIVDVHGLTALHIACVDTSLSLVKERLEQVQLN